MRQIRGGGINTCDSDYSVPIEEFKELYEKESALYETKSGSFSTTPLFFHYNKLTVDWNRFTKSFRISAKNKRVFVDVMAQDGEGHFLVLRDGQGPFLSKCFTGVRAVQSLKSVRTTIYHRVLIPSRETMERYWNSEFDDDVLLACNLESINYSGLEVFSSIEGKIVAMTRYDEGDICENHFVGNSYLDWSRLQYWIGTHLLNSIIMEQGTDQVTKTATVKSIYLCPKCEKNHIKTFLEQIGDVFKCPNCDWDSRTSMDDDVKPAVVTQYSSKDSGATGTYGAGGIENSGNGEDPTLAGGSNNDDSKYLSMHQNFKFDDKAISEIRPTLDTLYNDCLGKAVINSINSLGISFEYSDSLGNTGTIALFTPKSTNGKLSGATIYYNTSNPVIDAYILLEELIHASQRIRGFYDESYRMNVEIEAKMGAYIYFMKNNYSDGSAWLPVNNEVWRKTFGNYLDEPSEDNYQVLDSLIRTQGKEYSAMKSDATKKTFSNLKSFMSNDCAQTDTNYTKARLIK